MPHRSPNVRRKPGIRRHFTRRRLAVCALFLVALAIVVASAAAIYLAPFWRQSGEYDLAHIREIEEGSTVYGAEDELIGSVFVENRRLVGIEAMPEHLIDALVATEDTRFFSHRGIDPIGIIRAGLANYRAGRYAQGASTVTQQLARQCFELREKSVDRKIVEAFLARRIENQFSKEQILEAYFNRIYFGSGFYGIEAAARGYFGKPTSELTLGEAATLVGLIKRPNTYSPFNNLTMATEGRNHVLGRMVVEGFLKEDDRKRIEAQPLLVLPIEEREARTSYILQEVRRRALALLGDAPEATRDGLKIYTTVDTALGDAVNASVRKRLLDIEQESGYPHTTIHDYREGGARASGAPNYLQAAAVVIDNHTGALLASAGGRDFGDSEFDRAFQAQRPPGTAFTPLVFGAALASGLSPYTPVLDQPMDNKKVMVGGMQGLLAEWDQPEGATYRGQITARQAIAESKNAATVRLGEQVGTERVIAFAQKAGIESPLKDYPATFLGQSDVTVAEMALAYTAFGAGGHRPQAVSVIRHIEDSKGRILYKNALMDATPASVLYPLGNSQIHGALADTLELGNARAAIDEFGLAHVPSGGKTGTAYGFTDAWFVGYTSAVTCAVWVGFDQPKTIFDGATGARLALPIWCDIINATLADHPAGEIPPPAGTVAAELCNRTGQAATPNCEEPTYVAAMGKELMVRSTHFAHVPEAQKRHLTDCQFHSDTQSPGDQVFPRATPVRPDGGSRSGPSPMQTAMLEAHGANPVYPASPALVGAHEDPFGTLIAEVAPRPAIVAPPDPVPEVPAPDPEPPASAFPTSPDTLIPRAIPVDPQPDEEIPRARPVNPAEPQRDRPIFIPARPPDERPPRAQPFRPER
ncbi:hypothetical protein BH23VER1_BH23VER1_23740 [soil metagenome]